MTKSGQVREAVEKIYNEKIRFITFAFIGEDGYATYGGFGEIELGQTKLLAERIMFHLTNRDKEAA
jgi:hypothetical protein